MKSSLKEPKWQTKEITDHTDSKVTAIHSNGPSSA